MNIGLPQILRCPNCSGELELLKESGQRAVDGSEEIDSGLLICPCGRTFPILDGVPRLLEDTDESSQTGNHHPSDKHDPYSYIRESFSKEWGIVNYEEDKTWGWSLEQRKKIFLEDVALSAREIEGKTVLDAGCGNGTLTAAVATFNLRIVGSDLNDGLGRAARTRLGSQANMPRTSSMSRATLLALT